MDSIKIDFFSMNSSSFFPDYDVVDAPQHPMIAQWVAGALASLKTKSIYYGLFAKVQSIEVFTLTASGARELRSKARWSEARSVTTNWLRLLLRGYGRVRLGLMQLRL
ncbi:hypothetical protein M9H77_23590 [Catharanthus roseus]|uniref:Uncharacterized protein n=1 Tax=Catharanthus roseus TaxID=4058 RepID=A0ACC0AUZ7_CATRO|nr:hypothetical protein M9H77_23590 [Catharanthus roseus]